MRKSRHLSLTFKELTSTNYSTAMTVTFKKKKKNKVTSTNYSTAMIVTVKKKKK